MINILWQNIKSINIFQKLTIEKVQLFKAITIISLRSTNIIKFSKD